MGGGGIIAWSFVSAKERTVARMAYYRFDGWQNSDGEGAWGIWVELDEYGNDLNRGMRAWVPAAWQLSVGDIPPADAEPWSAGSGSGCFLTSACVDVLGKDDDCYELTILRRFRDEWLSKQDGGRSDIAQYYSFAPSVVNRIDSLPNRLDIYQTIYEELVAPCVEMIEQGRRLDAWQLYKQYSRDLIAQYSAQTA